MWFNSILLSYRACISGLAIWDIEWQGIFWFLIPGVKQWPFLWPLGVTYHSTETQNKAISLGNQYKTGQNLTLMVPQTHFWAFYTLDSGNVTSALPYTYFRAFLHMKWWELFEIWYQGSFAGLSVAPRRSNITLWRLKRSPFSRKIDKKSS